MRLAIDIPKQSGIQKNAINEYHWKDFWRTFDGLWHLKLAPYHASQSRKTALLWTAAKNLREISSGIIPRELL